MTDMVSIGLNGPLWRILSKERLSKMLDISLMPIPASMQDTAGDSVIVSHQNEATHLGDGLKRIRAHVFFHFECQLCHFRFPKFLSICSNEIEAGGINSLADLLNFA